MNPCFYQKPLPGADPSQWTGILIVIEGLDSSGRSSQIARLTPWLEQRGYAVAQMGLKRSELVGEELEKAKEGNVLSPRTMSLFYATDFYDQLENIIVPALRAGSIVLADRYIFTLMARDLVRGADLEWLESLYGMAVIPRAVFFLDASQRSLADRTLRSHGGLDYWESGMDLGLSRDWYESYVRYQRRLMAEFKFLGQKFGFESINANRSVGAVDRDLRSRIERVLGQHYPAYPGQPPAV